MEKNIFQIIFSGIATVLSFLFGGLDLALEILVIVIAMDYLTGIAKAWMNNSLDSRIGIEGIVKKIGYLVLVVLSSCIDKLLGDTGAFRTLIIYIIVANEGISITENLAAMDLFIPQTLVKKLNQLKNDSEGANEKNTSSKL